MYRLIIPCRRLRISPTISSEWDTGSTRKTFFGKAPDPTRPRYEDPGQNIGRSYKQFKEEKRQQLLSGDQKRKIPLKALVPEEYRGARYYTDVHMEVVDKKNALPKAFKGPYSILTPHRDGRFEHPGDRVPCNKSIQNSFKTGSPLMLPEGFEDSSRYALKKRYGVHPFQREITKKRFMIFLMITILTGVIYREIYCPMNNLPDPLRKTSDRILFWIPVMIFLYMVMNIGNIFTNSLLSMMWKAKWRKP